MYMASSDDDFDVLYVHKTIELLRSIKKKGMNIKNQNYYPYYLLEF